ncbi:MAG TPA: lysylphosphatidylglycerol synthase domain-containing protein [Caulobacteraceae bacterium]|nr:lysylphosphatidylglycerol synthase domain-containing protein [Caulobacteraceae bacterium]
MSASAAHPSGQPAKSRATAILAGVIGLTIAIGVIAYFNFGQVLAAIRPIGARGFVAIIVAQVALFVPLGLAWQMAGTPRAGPSWVFMWGRLMREAASDVLPFSQLGGLVIAGRVAVLGGIGAGEAFASSVIDITVEIAAQLIYTVVGIAILVASLGAGHRNGPLLWSLAAVLVLGGLVVSGMVATQQKGPAFFEKVMSKVAPNAAEHAQDAHVAFQAAYAQRGRLFASLVLHLIGWFGGAFGAWLILGFIGRPLPYSSVVAIESVLFAVRNAAFIVPSGLGVQEGAYALLGPLFGIPVEAALALSLIKRARDISIGVPVLLLWQAQESARLRRAAPPEPEVQP